MRSLVTELRRYSLYFLQDCLKQTLPRTLSYTPTLQAYSALLLPPHFDTVMSKSKELPSNGNQQTIGVAHDSTVSEKYQGTRFDQQDMSMLGKKQVLRRQFNFSTMLGFVSCRLSLCMG
jgi:hypothetical protein